MWFLLLACATDADQDGAPAGEDCDDADPTVSRTAKEICNGRDDDCSGVADDAYAAGTSVFYEDEDGDGHAAPGARSTRACAAPSGYGPTLGDCNDLDAAVFDGAPELHNGHDDDCDGRVDEDLFDEGRIFLTEIHRQPRFGAPSVVPDGQWFEVHSTASIPVDLDGAWVVRENAASGRDAFRITGPLVLPPKGYVVLCKDPAGLPAADESRLACEYTWGDHTQPQPWSAPGKDNTFNLQRDADSLSIWVDGDDRHGRLVDRVAWGPDWPREAARSMGLDPTVQSAFDNDSAVAWCLAKGSTWWVRGKDTERGTPGGENPSCR